MRKNFIFKALVFVMLLFAFLTFVSCGDDQGYVEPPHTECVDTDTNGKCDVCGKDVAPTEPPHTECVDTDSNGKCDVCGKEVKTYDITSIRIDGRDIRNFVICVNESDTESYKLAGYLNEILLENAGFELGIVEYGSATDRYISIATAERSGGEGFYVKLNSRNLEIVSEFSNKTLDMGILYFTEKIVLGEGEITLSEAKANVRDISYEEFGAVGDGKRMTRRRYARRICTQTNTGILWLPIRERPII